MMSGEAYGDGIRIAVEDRIARVVIDHPERLNAVSLQDVRALTRAITELGARADVGCIVVSGAGTAFCAGADLPASDGDFPDEATGAAMMAAVTPLIVGITHVPVPVIARVDGVAAGVGASIALACDLVVATDDAYFLLPFTGIGLMPDGGATVTIAAAIGRARAMELALPGERLPAAEARDAGLIARVCRREEIASTVTQLARRLADGATSAIAATKAAINEASLGDLEGALAAESRQQERLLGRWEYREGVAAFRARRRPDFRTAPSA